jgi:integrative and conjugative element protein (TIGR02256 family)
MFPTAGQRQALSELRDIQRITDGGIIVEQVHDLGPRDDDLRIDLLVKCTGPPTWSPSVPLNEREPVSVYVSSLFPLREPTVAVSHQRFAGLPHVVWGMTICLYLAQNDWDPSRGMWGLVDHLLSWFEHVAKGTITGPEIPWDPPLTYQSQSPGTLIVHPDLPADLEDNGALWTAWAVVEATGNWKYEVRRWTADLATVTGRKTASGRTFVAPVVALPAPIGFSYPTVLGELARGIADQGIGRDRCTELLSEASTASRRLWSAPSTDSARPLPLLLLGSPAPSGSATRARVAHLAAWCIDQTVTFSTKPVWMEVYDQRSRITIRRDASRPAQWLKGKRVLMLGCGALGAPIAEFCIRAGVKELCLVDSGLVRPGVLVRQPYTYADIGIPKVQVLEERLHRIAPGASVRGWRDDAITLIAGEEALPAVDLVVDATANRSVAAALERSRWTHGSRTPLLSVMVGHRCERGVGTLALPGSTGAGVDILRRLAVTASEDDQLFDVLDDFYPDLPRTEVFQPEPGCSDPTFVGSAADLAAFAGHLLNEALAVLDAPTLPPHVHPPRRWASVLRSSTTDAPGAAAQRRQWGDDLIETDSVHRYQIRLDRSAFANIRVEAIRMASARGPDCETGGLLLGQIDHACRVVWVTEVYGLPPGSEALAWRLRLDPAAARVAVSERRFRSRGLVGFIGVWHTHPGHAALPSRIDLDAMEALTKDGAPRLLLIVGGAQSQWDAWLTGKPGPDVRGSHGRPEMCAQLFFPEIPAA